MIAKRSIIPIFVPHLGCPNNCVFCDQHRITGSVTSPDEAMVRETIAEGLSKIPADTETQLAFYGGSFTAIPVYEQIKLLGAALPFLYLGELSSVRVSTRPDAIDDTRLTLLSEYGVKTIELGAQSMCGEVLKASCRGHTAEQTEQAANMIRECDFELVLQMMTGLPGDTKERTIETARRIIALRPDAVRIYPAVILEKTAMEAMWKSGEYKEHTVEEAVDWCAEIVPMFEREGIPIIRLGLNPTEELSGGAAVGGAYHPALGELVRSRVMLSRARVLLSCAVHSDEVDLGVNASEISVMTGQHRQNVEALKNEYGLSRVRVLKADVPKGTVVLL
ncbi:MAG: radical SAM protein [Clostridiales bacterium]|nr:radical SAM protein [Clostridiales bacterium]